MARKRRDKEKVTDPFERARLKKLRAAQRREDRKRRRQEAGEETTSRRSRSESRVVGIEADTSKVAVTDPNEWLRRSSINAFAWKIVNSHKIMPYWLSIEVDTGNPPVSGFYPCHMYMKNGRYYYGFLFRQCRDAVFEKWQHEYAARKELTPQQT